MGLKIQDGKKGPARNIKFSGQVDEDANFSGINISDSPQLILDLKDITLINSCGIREWIKWIATAPKAQIHYQNCPKVIVDQINMVDGFLPAHGVVDSFYVPYYCESCDQTTDLLLTHGKDFSNKKVSALESTPCHKCKTPAEMDVIESKYFKFLK